MIESGNGALYRNFEMVATVGGGASCSTGGATTAPPGFPWHTAYAPFGDDAAVCPTLTGTTFNRNLECVYLTTGGRLHHWWRRPGDAARGTDGGVFGPTDALGRARASSRATTAPRATSRSSSGTADGKLKHCGATAAAGTTGRVRGNIALSGAIAGPERLRAPAATSSWSRVLNDGQMQHLWRDDDRNFGWHRRPVVRRRASSGPPDDPGPVRHARRERGRTATSSCASPPAARCSTGGGTTTVDGRWHQSATFGHDVQAVAGAAARAAAA